MRNEQGALKINPKIEKIVQRREQSNAFERRAGKLLRQLPKVKITHTWEF